MENTDFIWVACSRCPQEGSRCWVEGQYCLKSCFCPFLQAPHHPFSAGAGGGCQPYTEEQGSCWEACGSCWCHFETAAPMAGFLGIGCGSLLLQVPLGSSLGERGLMPCACSDCMGPWPSCLRSIRAVNHGVPSMAWAGKALALGLSLDRRWEILTPESACGRLKGLDVPTASFYFLA